MVFQVNLLIYLYMAICICLLLFNLVYFARDFFMRKRDPEMVRKYMNKLCEMLETSGLEKISQKEEKFWTRKLSKSSGLIIPTGSRRTGSEGKTGRYRKMGQK